MFSFLPGVGRPTTAWFNAGPSSSFPDIDPEHDTADLSQPRAIAKPSKETNLEGLAPPESMREATSKPSEAPSETTSVAPCKPNSKNLGCRVFNIAREDGANGREVAVQTGALELDEDDGGKMEDEVLVFRYRGKIHATDHKCPHALFPLSKAIPFDIEDFGVVLSAGLQCPKHGWSFDMFTGVSDRAAYRLGVWETKEEKGEVWVRRKVRMG